jgi:ABC-type transport system involved in cytochrome c biogenesis permease subunit
MFETVIYVPWIAVLAGLILFFIFKNHVVIIASCTAALALLALLNVTDVNSSLENVQAVLDSQYWLIIHVLMVVASYGIFILGGILGHFYLISYAKNRRETPALSALSKLILQSMYAGIALLIPGTILGGVWAAESWGRFWDWDPKESWAFISACIYLTFIHAYTFQHIRSFGLAVGSIAGLLGISFTWYGVNYILGTGLHTYGFGKGGDIYYYLYFLAELLFLFVIFSIYFLDIGKVVEKNRKNAI